MDAVTIRLYGRTANQCFQLATCIATALRNRVEYIIPPRSVAPRKWRTYLKFPVKQIHKVDAVWKEPDFTYTEIPYNSGVLELDGFFQSEKYFKDKRDEVIDIFHYHGLPKYNAIDDTVSLHVRRGDFLKHPDKHPVVTVEYVTEAMNYFREKGYKKFLFFSDDLRWCKENFPGHNYSEGRNELHDIALQASCAHNIISNSSFSWFSGWLNNNPEKIVIAPKVWFGSELSYLNLKDLLPEEWIKM